MQHKYNLTIPFSVIPTYCFCNVACLAVRAEPSHRAEQTTQLLFGEKAKVLTLLKNDWAHIRCAWDGYEGWCKVSQLTEIAQKDYEKPTRLISNSHMGKLSFEDGVTTVPLGSEITRWPRQIANERGKFTGKKVLVGVTQPDGAALAQYAKMYLHSPYLWGGRTAMGIDCSGLTQMVYKLCNVPILRDASQQAENGRLVHFLETAQCGDLAFFANEEDKIVHVGMLLDNSNIIHATEFAGHVVIDRIDQGGIISVAQRKRTHSLRLIKRIVG
jgi:gamma-D-glutamyl-L-lysine dipeptidyl-peptidase